MSWPHISHLATAFFVQAIGYYWGGEERAARVAILDAVAASLAHEEWAKRVIQ